MLCKVHVSFEPNCVCVCVMLLYVLGITKKIIHSFLSEVLIIANELTNSSFLLINFTTIAMH